MIATSTLAAETNRAFADFEPRPTVRALDWFCDHVQTADGVAYDHEAFPHLGAPGGPCDMLDDEGVRKIILQWATRLGKTFFGQSGTLFYAATRPCPMMFASSSQTLATDVIARTYAMIERCVPLRDQLRPPHRRKQNRIDLDNCYCAVAWSRSVSTLADKAVCFGHASELDKWEHASTSMEADPLKLFEDRGKQFPSRKFVEESTPTIKGRSRVERLRLSSTNCRKYVPCPFCKKYQTLRMGQADQPGGLRWDKLPNGRNDKNLARRTARYICAACEGEICDEHRAWMMRRGVWLPEGTQPDHEAALAAGTARMLREDGPWQGWAGASWMLGSPARNGLDAGYHLSSLYALSLSWGDIAAEFVESKEKAQNLRNFINQWLGDTWEIIHRKQTWEQLGERLIDPEMPRGIVPGFASLVTVAIDRQKDHYVYVVDAWGPDRRHATIDYGDTDDLGDLRDAVIERYYPHADGGAAIRPQTTLIDSGYRPGGVYDFCVQEWERQMHVLPCKGSSTALESEYRTVTLGKNTAKKGMTLVHVDTLRTQDWIDRVLHVLSRDDPGGGSLFAGSKYEHQDILEQLLNDAVVSGLDKTNNERERWERVDPAVPNDFRDCRRYSYAAMLIATRGAAIRPRTEAATERRPAVVSAGATRRGGRPW